MAEDLPEHRIAMDKLVDELTLCGPVSEVPWIIDHLLKMKAAAVTDVCLEMREEADTTIKLLGERAVPAVA
jgi:hypothetical protein